MNISNSSLSCSHNSLCFVVPPMKLVHLFYARNYPQGQKHEVEYKIVPALNSQSSKSVKKSQHNISRTTEKCRCTTITELQKQPFLWLRLIWVFALIIKVYYESWLVLGIGLPVASFPQFGCKTRSEQKGIKRCC